MSKQGAVAATTTNRQRKFANRRLAVTLTAVAVGFGVPVTAFGQSAGTTQYTDPFAPHPPKPKAGQSCNHSKRPPRGFSCSKRGRGRHAHYVLVRK